MKTLLRALVHRLRQARGVLLRAQLAMTGAQILFWVALIGAPVGIALRARQRRMRREPGPPFATETQARPTPPLVN